MGLQKKLNKRLIKRTMGSKYIYRIESEEIREGGYENPNERSNKLKSFLQDGVNEMKKEIIKKSN